jgi:two-component system, sensor histidine kinase LadS
MPVRFSSLHVLWAPGVVGIRQSRRAFAYWRSCLQSMLVVVMLGLTSACSGPIQNEHFNLITEQAWVEDQTGGLQLEQVKKLEMKPWEGLLALGYGEGVVWMRLRIDPSLADARPEDVLYLRIRPSYLDEVVLIDPLQVPPDRPAIGDRHPLSNQSEPATMLMFEIPAGSGEREIWLKLKTTSTRMLSLELMNESAMRNSNARISHSGAIYLGLMVMFVLWGVVNMLMRPDRLIASFLIYQCLSIIFGFGLLGYARFYAPPWLDPKWVDLSTSLTGILATGSVITFSKLVMKDLIAKGWEKFLDGIILTIFPLLVIAVLAGKNSLGLMGNMAIILFMPPALLLIAATSPKKPIEVSGKSYTLPKYLIVTYLFSTLVLTFMTATPGLGLTKGNDTSLYIINLYSICSGLLMLVMLTYRNKLIENQTSELMIETQHQRNLAHHARVQREERERLLSMLGHELKTPLSSINMMLGDHRIPSDLSRKMSSSILDMSQVIERTVQTGLLEDNGIEPRWVKCQPFGILAHLCNNDKDASRIILEAESPEDTSFEATSDPFILTIIFRNMLDNALKYSAAGSMVHIIFSASNLSNAWNTSIRNLPGQSGWPDAKLIFKKYYRSPNATHKTGSGLGLYLIKSLSQKLGGELEYYPEDRFICFELSMPNERKASE